MKVASRTKESLWTVAQGYHILEDHIANQDTLLAHRAGKRLLQGHSVKQDWLR